MKVFLSWSGERSMRVANMLSDWLSCVIQACRPWVSTRDIDRGAVWFSEISEQLKDTTVGIICLTQENKQRPWILFEAGALAKGLATSRVCTLLIDLKPVDVGDPLAQLNHTIPTRESVYQLVKTLNNNIGSDALRNGVLEQAFATYWPSFERSFAEIIEQTPASEPVAPRAEADVMDEILQSVRAMNGRLRQLEKKAERVAVPENLRWDRSGGGGVGGGGGGAGGLVSPGKYGGGGGVVGDVDLRPVRVVIDDDGRIRRFEEGS